MKIFVTGHRGYIGSHLVDVLKQEGHTVVGCDLGLFDGCEWEPVVRPDVEFVKDTRTIEAADLDGCDVRDAPGGPLQRPHGRHERPAHPGREPRRLGPAGEARQAGRTCPGSSSPGAARCTARARSSTWTRRIRRIPSQPTPSPRSRPRSRSRSWPTRTSARSTCGTRTAYGHSPMLRIDLVVNNLLGSALAYGEIRIQSDGTPWRPLIHCRDIARAFVAFAHAPRSSHSRPRRERGRERRELPGPGRREPGPAPHSLREDRLHRRGGRRSPQLPREVRPAGPSASRTSSSSTTLATGMEELHRKMVDHGFSKKDFEGDQFVRLRTLKQANATAGLGDHRDLHRDAARRRDSSSIWRSGATTAASSRAPSARGSSAPRAWPRTSCR